MNHSRTFSGIVTFLSLKYFLLIFVWHCLHDEQQGYNFQEYFPFLF